MDAPAQMARGPLPLAALDAVVVTSPVACALSAVDRSGRVADRSVIRALGWRPGQILEIRVQRGVVVARAVAGAAGRVDRRGKDRVSSSKRTSVSCAIDLLDRYPPIAGRRGRPVPGRRSCSRGARM